MQRLGRGVLTRLPVVVALTIVWVLLWGNVGPITVLGGVLSPSVAASASAPSASPRA